mmetsp:Transcript_96365/g.220952  ORF Transcript_96365/g.220952 Transcript_96365/m.220952 type:complete len:801 (+) Transcript_96365:44-2446(+)
MGRTSPAHGGLPSGMLKFRRCILQHYDNYMAAWVHELQPNGDVELTFEEFLVACKKVGYFGDVVDLWRECDKDADERLHFEEIDPASCEALVEFKEWCYDELGGPVDMFRRADPEEKHRLAWPDFLQGLRKVNVPLQDPQLRLLFDGFRRPGESCVTLGSFIFLEESPFRRQLMINPHDEQLLSEQNEREQNAHAMRREIVQLRKAAESFRHHLNKKYGPLLRPWRKYIAVNGEFEVSQAVFTKAARRTAWQGDTKALWKALDTDNGGSISFVELDFQAGQAVAQFRHWCQRYHQATMWQSSRLDERYRSDMQFVFAALDLEGMRRLTTKEFRRCSTLGFRGNISLVFNSLDKTGAGLIFPADFDYLQDWGAPEWLVAEGNEEAAELFRLMVLDKYGTFVRCWRRLLVPNGEKRVSWPMFVAACEELGFDGDIPGCWRVLDAPGLGYITLRNIDEASYLILLQFREWMIIEFGTSKGAFKVLDKSGDGTVSFQEFYHWIHRFNFRPTTGDHGKIGEREAWALFENLKPDASKKVLRIKDILFLNDWEEPLEEDSVIDSHLRSVAAGRGRRTGIYLKDATPIPDRLVYSRGPVDFRGWSSTKGILADCKEAWASTGEAEQDTEPFESLATSCAKALGLPRPAACVDAWDTQPPDPSTRPWTPATESNFAGVSRPQSRSCTPSQPRMIRRPSAASCKRQASSSELRDISETRFGSNENAHLLLLSQRRGSGAGRQQGGRSRSLGHLGSGGQGRRSYRCSSAGEWARPQGLMARPPTRGVEGPCPPDFHLGPHTWGPRRKHPP